MKKRGDYFPGKDTGKDWSDFGVVCLLCGLHFRGGIDRAAKECAKHTTREHRGEVLRYAAFGSPQSRDAEKKARLLTSAKEAVALERILRENGTGWYFYALHYGVAKAEDHIRRVEEMGGERVERLRDMVAEGREERTYRGE